MAEGRLLVRRAIVVERVSGAFPGAAAIPTPAIRPSPIEWFPDLDEAGRNLERGPIRKGNWNNWNLFRAAIGNDAPDAFRG